MAGATADGFGPSDEATVLAEFTRTGDTAVEQAADQLQAAPTYALAAAPASTGRAGGAPAAAPAPAVGSAATPQPAGARPAAPPVVAPVLPPPPATPAAPALSGDAGAATAATGSQAQSAIAAMGQPAPPLPTPAPASAVPLTGGADPAQVAAGRATGLAGLEAEHASAAQQLGAFDPESDLHPPQPEQLVADATGPTAAPAPAPSVAAAAPTAEAGPAASAGPAGAAGQDEALAAARRSWAAEITPQLAQERANASQLTAQHAADQSQTRSLQVAALDAGVQERQGQQEQLRTQARQQLDGQRAEGRQRFTTLLEEGRTETATLVSDSGTEVQTAKADGEQAAAQHLQDGQQEAEAEQTRAEQQVQAEQSRAQSQSSSWIGKAVSVVRDAVASVRSLIAGIWQSAQAALQTILRKARDLATRAIDAAISIVSGIIRRVITTLTTVFRRVIGVLVSALRGLLTTLRNTLMLIVNSIRAVITTLVGWVRAGLGRLWAALKGLWGRLKAGFAALMARIKALIRRILRPIKVSIGPIQVFPRMGVAGRRLGRLTTGDIPIFVGEIPTEIGIFIVFATMRTDADLAFTGGGLGPGTIEKLELLVDPLASRYVGSGTVSVAADASAALTLTGIYSGNVSWMGLAGLGIEGGPQIPMSLGVKGANRTHAEVEYDRGTVRFASSNDLELCLIPAASVNAFLKIKAFSGLPLTVPGGSGPGKPGEGIHCGPNCPACTVDPGKPGPDHDDSVLPYKEIILYQHRWNLENYRTQKCWQWSFDLAAAANGSGASAEGSSRLDTSGGPTLFKELHAAAQPGAGAATPEGREAAARVGAGSAAGPAPGPAAAPTQDQETTVEECGDCCAGDTPSGKVKVKRWPHNGGFVFYGDGRRKHTSNTRCTPKGSGDCDSATLAAAAAGPPDTYGPCLTRWQQAAQSGDDGYGGQLGSEVTGSVYQDIVQEAIEGGVQDSKGSYYTDHGSTIGCDVLNGGAPTSIAMVNDAESKAHIIPVSSMPSGGASATKVRAQAICKCVGDDACGGGKIHKKYFDVDDCRTAKRDAEKICNNDPEMIEKCTRPKCYYRHGDYKCPA